MRVNIFGAYEINALATLFFLRTSNMALYNRNIGMFHKSFDVMLKYVINTFQCHRKGSLAFAICFSFLVNMKYFHLTVNTSCNEQEHTLLPHRCGKWKHRCNISVVQEVVELSIWFHNPEWGENIIIICVSPFILTHIAFKALLQSFFPKTEHGQTIFCRIFIHVWCMCSAQN